MLTFSCELLLLICWQERVYKLHLNHYNWKWVQIYRFSHWVFKIWTNWNKILDNMPNLNNATKKYKERKIQVTNGNIICNEPHTKGGLVCHKQIQKMDQGILFCMNVYGWRGQNPRKYIKVTATPLKNPFSWLVKNIGPQDKYLWKSEIHLIIPEHGTLSTTIRNWKQSHKVWICTWSIIRNIVYKTRSKTEKYTQTESANGTKLDPLYYNTWITRTFLQCKMTEMVENMKYEIVKYQGSETIKVKYKTEHTCLIKKLTHGEKYGFRKIQIYHRI